MISLIHSRTGIDEQQVPFFAARMTVAGVFLVVAFFFAFRRANLDHPRHLLQAVFMTLAWFFLLLPTQNPWYWIWALPFIPFARSRVWLILSGLTLAYYLRFWFVHHYADLAFWPTPYYGPQFFDFVVTWIEFGPWFVALILVAWRAGRKSDSSPLQNAA